MNLKILLLPGDGIGAEVTGAAVEVLKAVGKKFGHTLELSEGLLGGTAIHKTGSPFPDETKRLAMAADATLMGAVGLPEFDNAPPSQRPEAGLLGIRAVLDVFANLRPVRTWPSLVDSSPLKNAVVEGTDMLIVRELTGGLYWHSAWHRGRRRVGLQHHVVHTCADRTGHAHRVQAREEQGPGARGQGPGNERG
jgi:3-isopropylmalate dehydrogenase